MKTVGWIDPAAKVKDTNPEQTKEPAPVLSEPEAVETKKPVKKTAKK